MSTAAIEANQTSPASAARLVQIARDTGYKLAPHDTGLLAQWPEQTIRVG